MAEATIEAPVESQKFRGRERSVGKIKQLGRRLVMPFKRFYRTHKESVLESKPAGRTSASNLLEVGETGTIQTPMPHDYDVMGAAERILQDEDKQKAEHDKRKHEQGCLLRSFISAAVHAGNAKNFKKIDDDWETSFQAYQRIKPTDEEYAMRFAQMDAGSKKIEELNNDVIKLFHQYQATKPETVLSRALKNLEIHLNAPESIDAIKERIRRGEKTKEQILVFRASKDQTKSHVLHAVLKNNEIHSLSDPQQVTEENPSDSQNPKKKKRNYYPSEETNLAQGNYWTFSITPTRQNFALAA